MTNQEGQSSPIEFTVSEVDKDALKVEVFNYNEIYLRNIREDLENKIGIGKAERSIHYSGLPFE